jgi:dihydroorotate dehydrogenase (NAD+) catalytic subunit
MGYDLGVDLGKIGRLASPVILSSGTFGNSPAYLQLLSRDAVGAVVTKTITLKSKRGNPQPRIYEGDSFVINSVGLENPGAEEFLRTFDAKYGNVGIPKIVSISGNSVEEFKELSVLINRLSDIIAIELNLSCPNVDSEGLAFGSEPSRISDVVFACKNVSNFPIIAKLSPFQATDNKFAVAAENAGADAISLINTIPAMKIDIHRFRSFLGVPSGGMSGPAVKPIALKMVYEISRYVDIPVIGMGGIASSEDAIEFMMAGASAISIGTMGLVNPSLPGRVLSGIATFLEENSLDSVGEISRRFME